MTRYYFTAFAMAMALSASAQSMVVHTKEGTTFTHQVSTIQDVVFDENATPAFAFAKGSNNELVFDSNPSTGTISFNAQNYWILTDVTDDGWWTIDKRFGLAGDQELKITAEGNNGDKERFGSFTILCGSEIIECIVRQTDAAHNKNVALPDDVFRAYVLERYDADKDGNLSFEEALAIKKLELYNQGISSLVGIEHMKNLESLDCDKNNIEGTLNLSGLTHLKEVNCSHNYYTTLNLSGCESLERLTANDNYREEGWKTLFSLKNIDLTGCKSLSVIKIDDNALEAMDLRDCVALTDLNCAINQLSSIDVSNCTKLKYLHVRNNQLKGQTLDVSMCPDLSYLSCFDNELGELKLGNKPALGQILAYGNALKEINLSECPNLYQLELSNNQLSAIDVTQNPLLKTFDIANNPITSVDLSKNPKIVTLEVNNTELSALDLSANHEVNTLSANSCKLETINLSGCSSLYTLSAYDNVLNALDLKDCGNLFQMTVNTNHIASLDVSPCSKISIVNCNNNNLTSFNAKGCTELYSLDLEQNQLETLDLSSLRSLQEVYVSKNRLSDLNIAYLDRLTTAELYENNLKNISLKGLTALQELHLQYNQLADVDLKPASALTYLDIRGNLMKQLVLTDNLALTTVYARECQNLKTIYINEENSLAELYFDDGVTVLYGYPSETGGGEEETVDPELEGFFTKVTHTQSITTGNGEKYLLVCQKPNSTYVTLNERLSSNYVTSTDITMSADGIEANDDNLKHALVLTAGTTEGTYSIAGDGIYKSKPYMCSMGAYDASLLPFGKISFQSSADAVSPERTYWKIAFDEEGHVLVESQIAEGWTMRFNNDSNSQQFGVCQSSEANTLPLELYKCKVK